MEVAGIDHDVEGDDAAADDALLLSVNDDNSDNIYE